eukprot:CAMPEP_0175140182 /NCGR_PEP_ID=MMETSP0087-20121206/11319_1 /TAXON_ID=136419 /ORGANISM="Unknown Unknown, Strain D1" /LENGTH=1638 /DNA_ID=CAMNT_0016423281 /DNA_START=25 /DNA_END=4938 /DNA_ORIENTATION=+
MQVLLLLLALPAIVANVANFEPGSQIPDQLIEDRPESSSSEEHDSESLEEEQHHAKGWRLWKQTEYKRCGAKHRSQLIAAEQKVRCWALSVHTAVKNRLAKKALVEADAMWEYEHYHETAETKSAQRNKWVTHQSDKKYEYYYEHPEKKESGCKWFQQHLKEKLSLRLEKIEHLKKIARKMGHKGDCKVADPNKLKEQIRQLRAEASRHKVAARKAKAEAAKHKAEASKHKAARQKQARRAAKAHAIVRKARAEAKKHKAAAAKSRHAAAQHKAAAAQARTETKRHKQNAQLHKANSAAHKAAAHKAKKEAARHKAASKQHEANARRHEARAARARTAAAKARTALKKANAAAAKAKHQSRQHRAVAAKAVRESKKHKAHALKSIAAAKKARAQSNQFKLAAAAAKKAASKAKAEAHKAKAQSVLDRVARKNAKAAAKAARAAAAKARASAKRHKAVAAARKAAAAKARATARKALAAAAKAKASAEAHKAKAEAHKAAAAAAKAAKRQAAADKSKAEAAAKQAKLESQLHKTAAAKAVSKSLKFKALTAKAQVAAQHAKAETRKAKKALRMATAATLKAQQVEKKARHETRLAKKLAAKARADAKNAKEDAKRHQSAAAKAKAASKKHRKAAAQARSEARKARQESRKRRAEARAARYQARYHKSAAAKARKEADKHKSAAKHSRREARKLRAVARAAKRHMKRYKKAASKARSATKQARAATKRAQQEAKAAKAHAAMHKLLAKKSRAEAKRDRSIAAAAKAQAKKDAALATKFKAEAKKQADKVLKHQASVKKHQVTIARLKEQIRKLKAHYVKELNRLQKKNKAEFNAGYAKGLKHARKSRRSKRHTVLQPTPKPEVVKAGEGVRYVKVVCNSNKWMSFSWLGAYTHKGENVALHKKTSAKNSYSGAWGKVNTPISEPALKSKGTGNSWHSGSASQENWWQVDLGKEFKLDYIEYRPRVDCCPGQSAGNRIELYNAQGKLLKIAGVTSSKKYQKFDVHKLAPKNMEQARLKGARYIKLTNAIDNHWMSFSWLAAFTADGKNVAHFKHAKASSSHSGAWGNAGTPVTGSQIKKGKGNSWHSGTNAKGEWWMVDLGKAYDLVNVDYRVRTDCCQNQGGGLKMTILDEHGHEIYDLGVTNNNRFQTFDIPLKPSPTSKVRYVKLVKRVKGWMSFSWLAVYDKSGKNVAFNKDASAAGSHSGAWGDVNKPISGSEVKRGNGNSWHSSNSNVGFWWKVDLGRDYDVRDVVFRGRTDCCADQSGRIRILALDSAGKVVADMGTTKAGSARQVFKMPALSAQQLAHKHGQKPTPHLHSVTVFQPTPKPEVVKAGEGVRYVKVVCNSNKWMSFSWLGAYTHKGENVALHKKTSAKNSYSGAWGKVNTPISEPALKSKGTGNSWHSGSASQENWWQVDLGKEFKLDYIEYRPRVDCCPGQSAGNRIELYNAQGKLLKIAGVTSSKKYQKFDVHKLAPKNMEQARLKGARYIKLTNAIDNHWMSFSWLAAFTADGKNVAHFKHAKASSSHSGAWGNAGTPVTGSQIKKGKGNSWHSGTNAKGEWWMVDLGKAYDLVNVDYRVRTDCCQNQGGGLKMTILDEHGHEIYDLGVTNNNRFQTFDIPLKPSPTSKVRYVKLVKRVKGW